MKNRETVRDAITTLLSAALVSGATQYAQAVYGYQKADFQGLSPIVLVYSDGSDRPLATHQGSRSAMHFVIATFVRITAGGSYTEADAEDRLDKLEVEIAGVVESNRTATNWYHLALDGRSQVMDVEIGGYPYITELIPLRVEVFG